MSSWPDAFGELATLSRLGHDWDGLGAEAPSARLLRWMEQLFETMRSAGLPAPTRVVAGTDGALLADWIGPHEPVEIEATPCP